jgi:long-chain acyl-CoA synthetase
MKKRLRGVKRTNIQLDYDLYRVPVPIRGLADSYLSVVDLHPEGIEKTIMFVHGYAGVLESWEHQINHFARSYRVVAPDLRGHGQSDAPYSDYTMPELVSDLQATVEDLDFPEKFIMVAHSFGGSIAVEYANAHPERLEKLVLIATAGEYPLPRAAQWATRIPGRIVQPFWKYRTRFDAEFHVMKRLAANNMLQWQGWSLMRNITVPTLVVTGERDTYFPREVFDDVGKMIPNAEIYDVGSAKHKVQLERHEAVIRAIERFIGENGKSSWRGSVQKVDPLADRIWLRSYSQDTPPMLPIPKRPLYGFLDSAAHWLPKQTAIIFYNAKLTYLQLNEQVNRFAHVLHGKGVQPGDRVMIVLPNMPQMIIAFYATLKVGGVAVLPNPDADAQLIAQQVQQTNPKVMVTLESFSRLAQAIKGATGLEQFVFTDIRSIVSPKVYKMLIERWQLPNSQPEDEAIVRAIGERMGVLMADAPLGLPPKVDVTGEDLAAILFTSGTTDTPKGVCLTHRNLVANTLQTRHWIPDLVYGKETCLAVLPIIHSYGLINVMSLPIALAGTMVLLPVFDVEDVLTLIRDHKVSIFPGVPSMYTTINHFPGVREYGLNSIKACVSGAAPLPIEVQEEFEKLTHGRLVEGYGLTEASPVTHANPLYGVRKPGSIGIPMPNTEAKIVGLMTDEPLEPGEIGELVVRGPQVMQGYWQDEAATAEVLKDGWLDTGDVAVMDRDGYFQIISRKRDTILFGDYSVFPRDVEEVLYENNKVMEVAVVGVGKVAGEQKIKAFVVPRPNSDLTKEELLEMCHRRLEPYAVPWEIEFREELPKSFIGKVLRRMLVQEVDGNDGAV